MKKTILMFLIIVNLFSNIKNDNPTIKLNKLNLTLTRYDLLYIGDKIFQSETGGNKYNLVHWNDNENFPSLGIAHFIWHTYNGSNGIFGDSMNELMNFYKSYNMRIPNILLNKYSPFKSKKELDYRKKHNDKEIIELTNYLYDTREMQAYYLLLRMENSLMKMLDKTPNKQHLLKQFYRVAKSKNGLYVLVDYIAFKGEGLNTYKQYKNRGFGLRQVLEHMKGESLGSSAINDFANSAIYVLTERVNNAPNNYEKKWLKGWINRVNRYKY